MNNMSRSKIYEKDWRYSLLRIFWTDWNITTSYRKIEVRGMENLPEDGALLLTPNHCNTLMDALAMLRSYKGSTVFGARADLFNNPMVGRFMTFIRILPMVRQRDGLRNVLKNKDTQEVVVETLENGVRFCVFPEGTHRPMHSLRALGKGAMRIAMAADEKFGTERHVYMIPVGIEYGDYFRYRSSCLVNYGEPIDVTRYIAENKEAENEPQLLDSLRKLLASEISKLMTFINDDENYDAKWALTKAVAIRGRKKGYGEFGTHLYEDMMRNREIVDQIEDMLKEYPEETADLFEDVNEFEKARKRSKVSIYAFKKMKNPVLHAVGKAFAAVIGLPYFIFSAVTSLPMWAVAELVRGKVRDKAFRNTVSYGVKLGLTTILMPLYAVLAFCLAPWWLALALILLWIPTYGYFYDYIEGVRRLLSEVRLLNNRKLWKKFNEINNKYNNLTEKLS